MGGEEKTENLIRDIGYDSWHLLELVGFFDSIFLRWNSYALGFQVIGEGTQGVYDVVEVTSSKVSFMLSAIYASTKFK